MINAAVAVGGGLGSGGFCDAPDPKLAEAISACVISNCTVRDGLSKYQGCVEERKHVVLRT